MALLISAQEVIDLAFPNKNTLPSLIKDTLIDAAQEDHIRPVLNDLYDVLVIDPGALTGDKKALLEDFIRPALSYYVKFEALPELSLPITSKGARTVDDQFTSAASTADRAILLNKTRSIADALRAKMITFIEKPENKDKFPEYKLSENVTNNSTVFGGIVLDNFKTTNNRLPEDRPLN